MLTAQIPISNGQKPAKVDFLTASGTVSQPFRSGQNRYETRARRLNFGTLTRLQPPTTVDASIAKIVGNSLAADLVYGTESGQLGSEFEFAKIGRKENDAPRCQMLCDRAE